MMQADREHNFNLPVNCPAVTTRVKGLLSVCVIIINNNLFPGSAARRGHGFHYWPQLVFFTSMLSFPLNGFEFGLYFSDGKISYNIYMYWNFRAVPLANPQWTGYRYGPVSLDSQSRVWDTDPYL